MRIYRRLPTIQSGIATKRRKLWLIAASTLASAFLGVSEPALAQTFPAGNYPQGISVGSNHTPINVTLESGVQVIPPAGSNVSLAVNLTTNSSGSPALAVRPP
jgi:hypothetical protein